MSHYLSALLLMLLCGGRAYALAYTIDGPAALSVEYTETVEIECQILPEPPARVRARLAGYEGELARVAGSRQWRGRLTLAPVPLPPATYTVVITAEDAAGTETTFVQHLTIAAPRGGQSPWLPGARETGGPISIEPLGSDTLEYLTGDLPVDVRIDGGRPVRFDASLGGFVVPLTNRGGGRYGGALDFDVPLPPAQYTIRVEAEDQAGALTVFERAIVLEPPVGASQPWLLPQRPTIWDTPPLDDRPVPREPEVGGCGAVEGAAPAGWAVLVLVAFVGLRRRVALLAAVALAGCGEDVAEVRTVGRGEALVQLIAAGGGFENEAPLWPLHLGASIAGVVEAVVTEAWPLPGGGRGLLLRQAFSRGTERGDEWHELAVTDDGIYVVASSVGGRLHRPLFFLPAKVRVGMTWRTWARPQDEGRLDLGPLGKFDRDGGYELRVVRVSRHNSGDSPFHLRRIWEIEWKGPRNPIGTGQKDYQQVPTRGTLTFIEGVGPVEGRLFPAVSYREYGTSPGNNQPVPGVRVIPEATPLGPSAAPDITLTPLPLPPDLEHTWLRHVGVFELDDGHGPWVRFDGIKAGLGYPSAFPGFGGAGGNANLWLRAPESRCYAFEGGQLVSGQTLGVIPEYQTCVPAAASIVSPDGAHIWTVPLLSWFLRTLSPEEFGDREQWIYTRVRAVLPADPRLSSAPALFLARRPATWHLNPGWHLYPWEAIDLDNRYDVERLEGVAEVDAAALDVLGDPHLVAQSLGDGAIGLLARNASPDGLPAPWGFGRLDADRVVRDVVRYGPVGHQAGFRSDAQGREVWQVDRGGRVFEWRFTATGMERRVRGRLRLRGSESALSVVRLAGDRVLVVTAGPGPETVPSLVARLECDNRFGICFEQPHPAAPRLWTARLPDAAQASDWEAPAAIQGVTFASDDDGVRLCGPTAPVLRTPGIEATVSADGRCLALSAAEQVFELEAELPGAGRFGRFRVVSPLAPLLAGAE